MLSFNISYPDSIKFSNFANLTQRGSKGWKAAQNQGEDRVTFQQTLISYVLKHRDKHLVIMYQQLIVNNLAKFVSTYKIAS
jgi:hypothetical protein